MVKYYLWLLLEKEQYALHEKLLFFGTFGKETLTLQGEIAILVSFNFSFKFILFIIVVRNLTMGKISSVKWVCDICSHTVKHKNSVNWHKRLHSIEVVQKFKCSKCSKGFDRKDNTSRHKKSCLIMKKRKNECNICQKEFAKLWMLQRHVAIHVEKNTFKCEVCHSRISTADHKHTKCFIKTIVHLCYVI